LKILLLRTLCYFFFTDNVYPRLICNKLKSQTDDLSLVLDDSSVFDVVVESEIIAHCDNFLDAFIVLLACYYVFNLAYPKKLEGTLTFVQKFLLKIGDSTKTLPRVAGLITRLKKFIFTLIFVIYLNIIPEN